MRRVKRNSDPVFLLTDGDQEYQVRGVVGHDDAGIFVTLSHDYPDVEAAAGWMVEGRGVSFQVSAVDGRILRG